MKISETFNNTDHLILDFAAKLEAKMLELNRELSAASEAYAHMRRTCDFDDNDAYAALRAADDKKEKIYMLRQFVGDSLVAVRTTKRSLDYYRENWSQLGG